MEDEPVSWAPRIVDRHWLYAVDEGHEPVCLAYLEHEQLTASSVGKIVSIDAGSGPAATGLTFAAQTDAVMFARAANRLIDHHRDTKCSSPA